MIPQNVLDDFRNGHPDEADLVADIRKYLLTKSQARELFSRGKSIEDLLNGRVSGDDLDRIYSKFFDEWNNKLGFVAFG